MKKIALAILPLFDKWPKLPLVSVLVAAWNETAQIEAFLDSFNKLSYPNKELILIAGGKDKTLELAKQREGKQIIVLEQFTGEGKVNALRRNLSAASGQIIFLTDADCLLISDHVNRLLYPIICEKAQATTSLFRPFAKQLSNPFIWSQWACMFSYNQQLSIENSVYVPFIVGANCAVERSLIEAGWSDSELPPVALDYYLALFIQRSKKKILYVTGAYIETEYHSDIVSYILQKSRWNRTTLLLHYTFGDYRWFRNIFSSFKFTFLLLLPLLPLLLNTIVGLALWGGIWLYYFKPYWHALHYLNRCKQENVTGRHLWGLFNLMLADFITWAIILVQIAVPKWRTHWR